MTIAFRSCCLGLLAFAGPSSVLWAETVNDSAAKAPPLPTIGAYKTATPPVIDGRLADACWKAAPAADHFWRLNGTGRMDVSARGYVAYDAETLYIGVRCPLKDKEALNKIKALPPDQNRMFGEDTVEMFLDPYPNHELLYHFAVNVTNNRFSERNGDDTWKPAWQSAAFIGDDYWSLEVAIPFSSLSAAPKKGVTWGLNLTSGTSCWAPTFGGFALVKRFGRLTGLEANLDDYRWELTAVTGTMQVGKVDVVVEINNQTGRTRPVDLLAQVYADGDGPPLAVIRQEALHANEVHGVVANFTAPLTEPKPYRVAFELRDPETKRTLAESATILDGPKAIATSWDRSYYMNEPSARLTVTCGLDGMAGAALACQVLKAGAAATVLQEKVITLDKNRTGTAVFDLDTLPYGSYPVVIAPVARVGQAPAFKPTPATKELRKLKLKPGAVQYTDSGTLLRNGTPIFPCGFYYIFRYLHDPAFLAGYAKAGFNTQLMEWGNAEGYSLAAKAQQQQGVFPIAGIQNSAELKAYAFTGPETFPLWTAAARKLVRTVADAGGDAILAWATWDEPPLGIWYELTKQLHQIVQEEDPYHPTFTVNFKPGLFRAYAQATDILAPDPYPSFPGGRIRKVSEYVDAAVQAVDGKQPVMAVLQTFSEEGGCMPTPDELRCMVYLSIVHGAKGILFFSYDYRVGPMATKEPATWQAVQRCATEIKELEAVILSATAATTTVKINPAHQLDSKWFSQAGAEYLIVVNPDNQAKRGVAIAWSPTGARPAAEVTVLFENRKLAVNQHTVTDDFPPHAVHIYQLK